MQPDLRDPRDRPKARMTKDKGTARGGHVVTLAPRRLAGRGTANLLLEESRGGHLRHRSPDTAERPGLRRVPRFRRLVVSPAPLRALRPHRLLRLVALAAREPPCFRSAASGRPKLRAR